MGLGWVAKEPEEEPEHQRADSQDEGASGTSTPPIDNEHDHHAYDEDQEI